MLLMVRFALTTGARICASHEGCVFLRHERNSPAEIARQKINATILALFILIYMPFHPYFYNGLHTKLVFFSEYK